MDIATLGIEVQTRGVDEAASSLNRLTGATDRVADQMTGLQRQIMGAARTNTTYSQSASQLSGQINAQTSMFAAASNQVDIYGRRMRAAQMHSMNLMFQLQDIGMMLAAGQSPLMLAMQQGTQVAGIFAQVQAGGNSIRKSLGAAFSAVFNSTSLLTIGTIAAVASVGKLIHMWWEASDGAVTMSDRLDDLSDAMANYVSAVEGGAVEGLSMFVSAGEEHNAMLERMIELQTELAGLAARGALRSAVEAAVDSGDELTRVVERLRSDTADALMQFSEDDPLFGTAIRGAIEQMEEFAASIGVGVEQVEELADLFSALEAAEGPAETAVAARELGDAYAAILQTVGFANEEQEKTLAAIIAIEAASARTLLIEQRQVEAITSRRTELEREIGLLQTELQFGRESQQYREASVAAAAEEEATRLRLNGVFGAANAELVEMYQSYLLMKQAAEDQTAEAEKLAEFVEKMSASIDAGAENQDKIRESFMEQRRELEQQNELMSVLARHGEESAEYARASLNAQREAMQASLEKLGYDEQQTSEIMALWEQQQNVTSAINSSSSAAGGLVSQLQFATNVAAALVSVLGRVPAALAGIAGEVDGIIGALQRQDTQLRYQLEQGISSQAAQIKVLRDETLQAAAAAGATVDQLAELGSAFDADAAKAEELARSIGLTEEQLRELAKAAGGGRGGGKGAAGELEKLRKEQEKLREEQLKAADGVGGFREAMASSIMTVREFGAELANSIVGGLDSAVNAFAEFAASGFDSFSDFADNIRNAARQLISDLIRLFLRQKLILPIAASFGVAGPLGTAGQLLPAALSGGNGLGGLLGAGGVFGGLLGNFGSIGGGLGLLGGSGFLGGLGNALSGGFFNIGASATLAGGGLGATLGAALPLIGAIAAIASLPSILKKKTTVVDTGIRFALNQDDLRLEEFKKTRTASKFGAGKYKTTFEDLDPEVADPLRSVIESGMDGVRSLAESIGMDWDQPFEFGRDIKFKGLSEAERDAAIQQAVQDSITAFADAYFSEAENAALQLEGETSIETLQRLSVSLATVNRAFQQMGMEMMSITRPSAAIAADLAQLMGGLDNLTSALGTYYQEFYSEEERRKNLTADVTRQLAEVNVALPSSRDEFRAIVESLDLTTEEGRKTYAVMLTVAGAFAELNPILEETADNIDEAAEAARKAKEERQADVDASVRQYEQIAAANLRTAEQQLRAAVSSEQERISDRADMLIEKSQARTESQLSALADKLSGAQARADRYRDFYEAFTDALDDREHFFTPGAALQEASETLRQAAARGRIGSTEEIEAAIRAVSDPDTDLFASFEDYQREFLRNSAAIFTLKEIAGDELSEAQRQVRAIEQNMSAVEETGRLQVMAIEAARDAEIQSLEQLLMATLGVETATLSVTDAIARFLSARKEAEEASSTSPSGFQKGSFGDWLNSVYMELLGRGVRKAGLDYWGEQFVNGQTMDEIFENIARSEERKRFLETGIPRFASGGLHSGGLRIVGESGPELEATGPARIYSSSETARMMRSDPEADRTASMVRLMLKEASRNAEVMRNQARDIERMRKRFDQWNNDGLPPERV